MARKIYISSAMSGDEGLSEVAEHDPMIALMWPWMLTYFDDWGRAKASPREIKNNVFQANPIVTIDVIKTALQLYHQAKLLTLYETDGKSFMYIDPEKWFRWQTHIRSNKRENDGSKIPPPQPPDDDNIAQVRASARDVAEVREDASICTASPSLSPSPSLSLNTPPTPNKENAFAVYEREKFGFITSTIQDKIIAMIEECSEPWVIKALEEASYYGKRYLPYVKQVLDDWQKLNHPEPWTLGKQDKPKNGNTNVRPFNQSQRTANGRPKISISQPDDHVPLTPDEAEALRRKVLKLDAQDKASGGP